MIVIKLENQVNFLVEVDKVKQVLRNTILMDKSRKENDAEHTWHMALAAITLQEYSNDPNVDILKVVKMALIHDIVEIDAGDISVYSIVDKEAKALRERKAAERIFGLLPYEQSNYFFDLWNEFEEGVSSESRFAQALDSFMPILHNYRTQGMQWRALNVTSEMVLSRNKRIQYGSNKLWNYIESIVEDAVDKGYLMK